MNDLDRAKEAARKIHDYLYMNGNNWDYKNPLLDDIKIIEDYLKSIPLAT
jgi:hypothetical protein